MPDQAAAFALVGAPKTIVNLAVAGSSQMYYEQLQWSRDHVPRPLDLTWDENNIQHLWQSHRVTSDEVEEVLLGIGGEPPAYLQRRDGDYYEFLGETGDRRLLLLVGEFLNDGNLYVFAARNMNDREKRKYRKR